MVGPLLESKYRVPAGRAADLRRTRLIERLETSARHAVTLVSAPAGFGKTTLLTSWLAGARTDRPPVAWVSLDTRDADPATFWGYVIAALRATSADLGDGARGLLESGAPAHLVVTALLADLDQLSADVLLVLDDYHLVESNEVHENVAYLLDHQPPRLHLVLASRSDPPLALAALRARGQLLEVRAADLRFTAEEAQAYLNGPMGLALSDVDIAALDRRTEGWVAALQLAGLSMQGRDDASAFIAGFAGDDRYIVDYLVEEVLARQGADVRGFLLETSVLDRLCGPLCDAVTGRTGGRATLVALERANLFLVPLDDRRQWWRYHHLFGEVLQAHLRDERADVVARLHERASIWYEQEGDTSQAVRHAMAARDFARAADLMEVAIPALSRERREAEFRDWVLALPEDVVAVRPVLGVALAGALAQVSQFDTVAQRLDTVERSVRTTPGDPWPEQPPPGLVVNDLEGYRAVPSRVEMYRAALALAAGDLTGTVRHAEQALTLGLPDDDLTRAAAGALGGLAAWATGDLEGALAAYRASVSGLRRAGFVADVLACSIAIADLERTLGVLHDALRTYEDGLELAARQPGTSPLRGTSDMHVGIASVLIERDDRVGAAEHLAVSARLGEHNGLPQNAYRSRLVRARLLEADGDLDGALALVDEADRAYVGDYSPNVRPVPAVRARLQIRRGELAAATAWAGERGLSVDDDPTYLREFEHVTLARLLLAQHAAAPQPADALLRSVIALLDRLLTAAEQGRRTGSAVEVLLLRALAHERGRDRVAALVDLQRSVALAEAGGWVRVFADEGPALGRLLGALGKSSDSPYLRRLAAASTGTAQRATGPSPTVVPLSDRELAVLRLLGSDLSGPDIARQLSVSVNTLRTHTKNIYAKLGVTSRRAAVRQAADLARTEQTRDR